MWHKKSLTEKRDYSIFLYGNIKGAKMKDFIRVMKALSDPGRVKILKMLQQKSMCVCEIQVLLELAQPTVSKHLKILDDAGLVTCRKNGLWVNYQLADGNANPYAATLLGNLKHWLQEDPSVLTIRERLPTVDREVICRTRDNKAANA
jgi:ArsR family transcriptional regulator